MQIDILSALISPNKSSSSMEPIVFTRLVGTAVDQIIDGVPVHFLVTIRERAQWHSGTAAQRRDRLRELRTASRHIDR
jgi:hypothetical protein